MAITLSVASISPTAFAADGSAQTVIDRQRVNGWDSFDVDLRPFGAMNEFTTVTITCVTGETEIVGDDGKAPEAAFGVVINDTQNQATMPRCLYDSNETFFEMTLTAERLENNPVFKVQSQLPKPAIFTVTVDGLTEDNRKALSLAPLSENVTVYTYDASSWMNGGNCYGSVSIPEENISCDYDITYGSTNVGELRTNVKYISTSAIPYYGDSLDAGADAFNYNVAIVCGNGVVVSTMSSEDSFDLTSPGTTYIDDFCTNELDSFVVYEIRIEISAKLFWNGEISKKQAVSDKIRLSDPKKPVHLEIAYDPRIALPLPAIDKYSMVLTAEEGDGWLIGSYAYADYIVPDINGKTYGNTTIGALRSVLKKFNTTANTYLSDSLNAGENAFEYCIDMEAKNGEDCIRFGNDSFGLTESGTVYVDNFDYKGTKMSSGIYDDYVITAIIIKVQSALGWNDVEKKSFALCEDIRNMTPGDTLTLNLKEDTREDVKTEVTDTSVTMDVWTDSWLDGVNATGCTSTLTIPGITYGTTKFEDIKETIRSLNVTVPYSSDTLNAGKEAFRYKFVIEFADGNTWWGGDCVGLGESLTQLIDDIDVSGFEDTTIARVYISIESELEDAGDGKQRAVSEVIRAQEADTSFTIDIEYFSVSAHSLLLGDDIGVKYYIEFSDDVLSDPTSVIKFTVNGRQTTAAVSEAAHTDNLYEFICPIAAAEMNDTITGQLYVGGQATGDSFTYSVKTYADYILANSEKYADEVPLVEAMLNYGAAAEKYFRGSTEISFTKPATTAEELAVYKYVVTDSDKAYDFVGQVITLNSKVTAKLYFSGKDFSVSDFTVKQNGISVDASRLCVSTDDIGTYLAISGISANEMGESFTIIIGGVTVSNYSVFSYVQEAINSSIDGLPDVVSALYVYGCAAEIYSKL